MSTSEKPLIFPAMRTTKKHSPATAGKAQRGIQSIEVGGKLLRALADHGAPMMLRDLASAAAMPPGKAHPYLVSFGKIGLIEQDPTSGRYALGPLALQLGLASLQQLDALRLATPAIATLQTRVRHTVAAAVLGNHGPTVVRLEDSGYPLHINLRVGTVMSIIDTATGRIFAAFLPIKLTETLFHQELARPAQQHQLHQRPKWKDFEKALADIRKRGVARALGSPIPGINALSVPVFDHTRSIVLAITALGPSNTFDASWNGPVAHALTEAADDLSHRLGYAKQASRDS